MEIHRRVVNRTPNRWLSAFRPEGYDYDNGVMSVSHQIFTPEDWERRGLIEDDDRPYAATLLFGVSYNSRDENTMQSMAHRARPLRAHSRIHRRRRAA